METCTLPSEVTYDKCLLILILIGTLQVTTLVRRKLTLLFCKYVSPWKTFLPRTLLKAFTTSSAESSLLAKLLTEFVILVTKTTESTETSSWRRASIGKYPLRLTK